jgi:hypothetical protein
MEHAKIRKTMGALIALGLSLAGCRMEGFDGVPAYPGSSAGPGYRTRQGAVAAEKQVYYTADAYPEVVAFYDEYISDEPGWEGHPDDDSAVWRNNMMLDSVMSVATPVDPSRTGKLITVVDEGTRTVVRTYSSHPVP